MNTVNCMQMGFEFGSGFSLSIVICAATIVVTWFLCDMFRNIIRFMIFKYRARKERKKQRSRWGYK